MVAAAGAYYGGYGCYNNACYQDAYGNRSARSNIPMLWHATAGPLLYSGVDLGQAANCSTIATNWAGVYGNLVV